MVLKSLYGRRVAIIEAVRTPFLTSGSGFKNLYAYQLLSAAFKGLKMRMIDENPEFIISGNVIQDVSTSNISRESALIAGFSDKIPATTVTLACISSNFSSHMISNMIGTQQIRHGISGGVETMSDAPIRFSKPIRERLIRSTKIKSFPGYFKLLKGLKLKDLVPEAPSIKEFSSGELMGESSEKLSNQFNISRLEQDEYCLRSHKNAQKGYDSGFFNEDLVSLNGYSQDNGIRANSSIEGLGKLKPAFSKPYGTHTAANSSFLTDGASAMHLMDSEFAKSLGIRPRGIILGSFFVAQDPFDELLLGPAYAIAKLLSFYKLTLSDIGVFEIHEAFAGQVLSNIKALDSDSFCMNKLNLSSKIGEIPIDKVNAYGGSLSIGHPFGATGIRLLNTCARRLELENQELGIVAACAAGGHGVASLIQRYS